ncbi:MAG: hypothetical protein P8X95_11885 [Anaerolineales bacterium]
MYWPQGVGIYVATAGHGDALTTGGRVVAMRWSDVEMLGIGKPTL